MPKIIIDEQEVECQPGISALQAALDAGWDVPHYCFHPGLPVVASCRLCLMEMKMPHPKTQELGWAPKLIPSCQTPIRDGMEIRFASDKVKQNQQNCMEFFLLNHPLDCPVCDQAGECHLQDYSYKFGHPESRMVDQKLKNPKKDLGPHTLLYQDRCVMCTRCVRFSQEISGTQELCIVNRGSRAEIDVFPGVPLDNPLQGNVVDICPVGCLLDKQFLFKRRVWELKGTPSICPGCATGCSIRIDQADQKIYRLKPRYNPKVNDWWMCDEGRFGFEYVHVSARITMPLVRRGLDETVPNWNDVPGLVRFRFEQHIQAKGDEQVVCMLSPFMACEEAWLLVKFIRDVAPQASLVMGPLPMAGDDQHFPVGATGDAIKFTILKEKAPNRLGIERILKQAGGNIQLFDDFSKGVEAGDFSAAWLVGGYPKPWVDKVLGKLANKFDLLIVQDMFENAFTKAASIVLPACAWAEREGSFVNSAGLMQPFDRSIDPPEGARRDGQYLFELAGYEGLYRAEFVQEMMAAESADAAAVYEPPLMAAHAH